MAKKESKLSVSEPVKVGKTNVQENETPGDSPILHKDLKSTSTPAAKVVAPQSQTVHAAEATKQAPTMHRPTESELEILTIVWDSGEATVRTVHEKIAEHKNVGYTTTLKLMQIMHTKGILDRNTDTRTHVYSPSISKEKTLKSLVSKLIDTAFGGSAYELVNYVLEHKKIGKKDTESLKKHFKGSDKKGR